MCKLQRIIIETDKEFERRHTFKLKTYISVFSNVMTIIWTTIYLITIFNMEDYDMSKLALIIEIGKLAIAFLAAAIPGVILFLNSVKKFKVAKDQAEKEEAKNDMLAAVNILISDAESLYSGVDNALKNQGQSAGILKKDSVMAKLQAYAIDKGYTFDSTYWSEKIDEIVTLTKAVNTRK